MDYAKEKEESCEAEILAGWTVHYFVNHVSFIYNFTIFLSLITQPAKEKASVVKHTKNKELVSVRAALLQIFYCWLIDLK